MTASHQTSSHSDECPYGASECPKLVEMKQDLDRMTVKVEDMNETLTAMNTRMGFMTTILSVLMLAVFGVSLI